VPSVDDIVYGPVPPKTGTPEQQADMHYTIENSGGDRQRAIDDFCEEQRRQNKSVPYDPGAIYDHCKSNPLP
jgi:hypothetical protein